MVKWNNALCDFICDRLVYRLKDESIVLNSFTVISVRFVMRILRGSELSILVCKLHLQVRLTNKKSLLQWQNGEKRPALNSFNERARKTTLNLLRRVEGKHMRNLFTVTYCLQYRLAIRSERLLN
jgi:hypothetical protein